MFSENNLIVTVFRSETTMFVWDKPWPGAIKKMFCSAKKNSQNFCFQPIIFEHFSVSMGVENILRLKNILKFMASGHACLSVGQKERYISHHAFCRYIFTIQQKVEHTGRQEASQLVVLY